MKVNSSRYLVLGLLARESASGYDIKRRLEQRLFHVWSESYPQIYSIIKSLAQEKKASIRVQRQKGRPDRQVCSITEAGLEELRAWVAQPCRFPDAKNEPLLKLLFSPHGSREDTVAHLERLRDHHLRRIAELDQVEAMLRLESEGDPLLPAWVLTADFERNQATAAIRWCETTLGSLQQKPEVDKLRPRERRSRHPRPRGNQASASSK